jgi:hypothetical protein
MQRLLFNLLPLFLKDLLPLLLKGLKNSKMSSESGLIIGSTAERMNKPGNQ